MTQPTMVSCDCKKSTTMTNGSWGWQWELRVWWWKNYKHPVDRHLYDGMNRGWNWTGSFWMNPKFLPNSLWKTKLERNWKLFVEGWASGIACSSQFSVVKRKKVSLSSSINLCINTIIALHQFPLVFLFVISPVYHHLGFHPVHWHTILPRVQWTWTNLHGATMIGITLCNVQSSHRIAAHLTSTLSCFHHQPAISIPT